MDILTVDLNESIAMNAAYIEHLEAKWEKAPTGNNEYKLYQAKDSQVRLIAKRDGTN